MTNATAITIAMGLNLGLSQAEIEKAAVDYDLVSTDTYVKANAESVNAGAASLLASNYTMITSKSEGGLSLSLDSTEVKKRIAYLAKNSGGKFIVPVEMQVLDRRVRARNVW
jgi:hypothetical protein